MTNSVDSPFGRWLTQSEAYALNYHNVSLRRDDGTVQSMETRDGYRVTYGAPSYTTAVALADSLSRSTGVA